MPHRFSGPAKFLGEILAIAALAIGTTARAQKAVHAMDERGKQTMYASDAYKKAFADAETSYVTPPVTPQMPEWKGNFKAREWFTPAIRTFVGFSGDLKELQKHGLIAVDSNAPQKEIEAVYAHNAEWVQEVNRLGVNSQTSVNKLFVILQMDDFLADNHDAIAPLCKPTPIPAEDNEFTPDVDTALDRLEDAKRKVALAFDCMAATIKYKRSIPPTVVFREQAMYGDEVPLKRGQKPIFWRQDTAAAVIKAGNEIYSYMQKAKTMSDSFPQDQKLDFVLHRRREPPPIKTATLH